jgi:hypothetical protein
MIFNLNIIYIYILILMIFNLNIVDLTTAIILLYHEINNIDIKYFLLFDQILQMLRHQAIFF